GAMGFMQIMPDTWGELRLRYGLGTDPYDPHDNIAAGTAYLREMHDRYGEPGFLAAYNAGPDRYEEYVATGRPLPSETVSYMANVASLLEIIGNGTAVDALAVPTWASSPLFVTRPNASSVVSGAPSGVPTPSLPIVQKVPAGDALARHAEGLSASMPRRNVSMIRVGLLRGPAGDGTYQRMHGLVLRNPIIGRQDKAGCPAVVAALLNGCLHVVLSSLRDEPPKCWCGA
ncbi:MAG: lytic transglycosylase domain-containing protein, partial [Alphaproteobacteria bacterium]|nr:lytic transglycosylase domain-containing protein [Alphaproteobacteria bacterium]